MKYQQLINRLIAADDLHYDEQCRRFVSLSEQEVQAIQARCLENGITEHEQINKVVQWCGSVRIGQLLHDSFLSGRVRLAGLRGDEPLFAPLDNAP